MQIEGDGDEMHDAPEWDSQQTTQPAEESEDEVEGEATGGGSLLQATNTSGRTRSGRSSSFHGIRNDGSVRTMQAQSPDEEVAQSARCKRTHGKRPAIMPPPLQSPTSRSPTSPGAAAELLFRLQRTDARPGRNRVVREWRGNASPPERWRLRSWTSFPAGFNPFARSAARTRRPPLAPAGAKLELTGAIVLPIGKYRLSELIAPNEEAAGASAVAVSTQKDEEAAAAAAAQAPPPAAPFQTDGMQMLAQLCSWRVDEQAPPPARLA